MVVEHNIWILRRFKSPATWRNVQQFGRANIRTDIKAPHFWSLASGIPSQRASNAEKGVLSTDFMIVSSRRKLIHIDGSVEDCGISSALVWRYCSLALSHQYTHDGLLSTGTGLINCTETVIKIQIFSFKKIPVDIVIWSGPGNVVFHSLVDFQIYSTSKWQQLRFSVNRFKQLG